MTSGARLFGDSGDRLLGLLAGLPDSLLLPSSMTSSTRDGVGIITSAR